MTKDELRAHQLPLKERYRAEPAAALWTLHATGVLAPEVTCDVDTFGGTTKAGLHPATGGTGLEACSGDMLLQALVACAGVTLSAVATSMGIVIRDGRLTAEGDLDFRGTLGTRDVPVGFQRIRLKVHLDTDASEDQQRRLLEVTERYCVVFQTLAHSPVMELVTRPD
jgi:uncharacterized OsmC-like protein